MDGMRKREKKEKQKRAAPSSIRPEVLVGYIVA
jgi:hypothetical protein